jgi:hypothetical protein
MVAFLVREPVEAIFDRAWHFEDASQRGKIKNREFDMSNAVDKFPNRSQTLLHADEQPSWLSRIPFTGYRY